MSPPPATVPLPAHPAGHRRAVPAAAVVTTIGLAVLLVASGYSLGRTWHHDVGMWSWWAGEALLLLPALGLMLWRGTTRAQALLVVTTLAVGSYAVKVSYSPIRFRFPDELQHLRTLEDLMAAGDLSTPNPALPISTSFPGLELVTSAVCGLTGASTFVGGVVVVGIAHVVQGLALFLLFETVTRSWRVAAVGMLVYATNPHYQHFNSLFIYQAMATGMIAVCLWQLAVAVDGPRGSGYRWRPFAAAALLALAVVPTHHVTTYATLVVGSVLLLGLLLRRDLHRAGGVALLLALLGLAAVNWAGTVGSHVISYLEPAARSLVDGVGGLLSGRRGSGDSPPPQAGDLLERLAAYVSVVVLVGAIAWTGVRVHRRPRARSWTYAFWLGSLTYLGAVAMRVVSAEGGELYGRAVSFVFVPLAVVVATAMLRLSRRRYPRLLPVALVGLACVYAGGVASGWPPSWERLPRGYLPAGYESSIEKQGITAARWARASLPPYDGIAADYTNYTLMGTIGRLRSARTVADLFESPTVTAQDREIIRDRSIAYVLTDLRLTRALPAFGAYFPDDPNAFRYLSPLETGRMTKFATIPAASRLYDSGDIALYDVRSVWDG